MSTAKDNDAIDMAVFSELCAATGAEFVAELVGTFRDEATAILAELRRASAAGDAVRCKRIAHSLKSNANTFGATKLATMARAVESHGLGHDPAAEMNALAHEFNRAADRLSVLSNART